MKFKADKLLIDVQGPDECWEWLGSCQPSGYGQVRDPALKTMITAHRRMYEIVHGPINDRFKLVMHTCDNRKCVNPAHLRLGSHKENTQDMRQKQRARGQPRKLSDEQVAKIRELWLEFSVSQKQLADAFGVNPSVVSRLLGRKSSWEYR